MTHYEEDKPLLSLVGRFWWLMACRGLIITVFGALVLTDPYVTTVAFIVMFTLYMLVSGIIAFVLGFQSQEGPHRWSAFFVPGGISLVIGLLIAFHSGLAVLALIGLVGTWSLSLGLMEALMAIQLRNVLIHRWALFLAGGLSCFAGTSLLLRPFYIVLFDFQRVGTIALVLGSLLMVLAIQIRKVTDVSGLV